LLREGLSRILSAADFRIVASASSVNELALTAQPRHRSILLIIDAGDDLSAAARQVELFKKHHPTGRTAVLADHNQPNDIVSAFRAGANAYFVKVAPCDAFIKSLELVMLGETILPAAMLSTLLDGAGDDRNPRQEAVERGCWKVAAGDCMETDGDDTPRLSMREKCILTHLIEGDSNKVIARKIDIAEATVKVHVKAILRKIRVHNRTQAAIWAMSSGLSIPTMDNALPPPAKAALHPPLVAHLVRTPPARPPNGSAELPAIAESVDGATQRALFSGDRSVRGGVNRRSN
jgi:two-component system nitrate/nitrite response regulator NarL